MSCSFQNNYARCSVSEVASWPENLNGSLGKASTFWNMVFGSQLTSGTVFGEEVGCRLLMFHLKSLCFISCCCVLCWEQFFVFCFLFLILYFCMPFAKWCCFCTRKKLLGNSPVARVWLFWKAGLPEILYLVVIINRLILKCCLLGHLLIKDFSNMSEWGQLMLSNSPWTKEDWLFQGRHKGARVLHFS